MIIGRILIALAEAFQEFFTGFANLMEGIWFGEDL